MTASIRALKFFGDFLMTDQLSQSRSSQSSRALQSSLSSARKLALMASVVTGLGIAAYGVSSSSGGLNIFGSPAHAQTNDAVSSTAQPQSFARSEGTRLNSSHVSISYAVFCLKKK